MNALNRSADTADHSASQPASQAGSHAGRQPVLHQCKFWHSLHSLSVCTDPPEGWIACKQLNGRRFGAPTPSKLGRQQLWHAVCAINLAAANFLPLDHCSSINQAIGGCTDTDTVQAALQIRPDPASVWGQSCGSGKQTLTRLYNAKCMQHTCYCRCLTLTCILVLHACFLAAQPGVYTAAAGGRGIRGR